MSPELRQPASPDPDRGCDRLQWTDDSLPLRTAADPARHSGHTLYEALHDRGITVGMVVQSTAGHDYSRIGIVIALRPPFALIVDGRHRPVSRPKRKRLSHLRPVVQASAEALAEALGLPDSGQKDSAVRSLIREATAPLLVRNPDEPGPETDRVPDGPRTYKTHP